MRSGKRTFGDKSKPQKRRERRPPKPLDDARLRDLALAYVARFATSAGKLEDYLKRKLRERGYAGAEEGREPDIAGLVQRYVELGYIDDVAFAKAKSGSLLRRGYGPRRVAQDLHAAGIDEHVREDVRAGEGARRDAVVTLARKRRFGPFAAEAPDRARREKQIAALMRAGHGFDHIRAVMDARNAEAAEQWALEADEWED